MARSGTAAGSVVPPVRRLNPAQLWLVDLRSLKFERSGRKHQARRTRPAMSTASFTACSAIWNCYMEMPGGRLVRHLEVCGRKMPFIGSIESAHKVAQRLVDEYGERALQAERNEGIDWKGLSHAVRVGREALELLETGRITFPLTSSSCVLLMRRRTTSTNHLSSTWCLLGGGEGLCQRNRCLCRRARWSCRAPGIQRRWRRLQHHHSQAGRGRRSLGKALATTG